MFAIASLVTLALAASASAYSVSTPDKLELCQDAKFTISGGSSTDTYTAYFVHGDNPCGDEIFHMEVTGTEFTWKVNATEGTSIMVALDNGSDEQWSGAVKVTGTDASCIGSSSSAARSTVSVAASSTRAGSTYTAPVNAASSAPSASDVPSSGSRAAFGITSALAVLGAAVVGISL